jgi:ABC-type antimicrobial peptide transport system permease subunit
LALGLTGVAISGRLLESMLYGVGPGDPMLLAAGCGVLVVTSLAASYLPARRATGVDPIESLRSQ